MDAVPFFGVNFNYYFPIILILLVISTATNISNYLLGLCKVKTFSYDQDHNDESTEAGKDIIYNERERLSSRGFDVQSKDTNFPDVWGIFNRNTSSFVGKSSKTKTRNNDDFHSTSKIELLSRTDDGLENI